ncbi:PspC domain-containing protein [Jatrophihabitans telluris]|uniref:PspC domain-containing protein n=1 Tax=Jatrophihabitans telluris TaxID=2038343 RepID=A0ABY4QY02_9ACTN|nr:PspC domain-containing protein [Jatrophihabitans telluris]UQX87861.1 PspC domain-containing protein [Jatrophihabitans telluris]
MTAPAPPPYLFPAATPGLRPPRLYRAVRGRWFGGVACGLARYLDVSVWLVRIGFFVAALSGGLGILLYGAFWIVLRTPPDQPQQSRRAAVEFVVALVIGAGVLLANARTLPLGWWFVPVMLAIFGGALVWRQASETERDRWRRLSRSSLAAGAFDRTGALRLALGITLVLAGGVFVLFQTGTGTKAIGVGLAAVLVTVGGLALITGPWWLRLVQELGAERTERIRNEERADIAAHLHDSVLQTLALIQRNANSPREVARLARSQERELRTKLYGSMVPTGTFAELLAGAAAEIEDTYAITIDLVVVGGERDVDTRLDALVAAAREAMVNAAKHAGVTSVSVYAELAPGSSRPGVTEAQVFVRDRGIGFDPDIIEEDRQGVRGSIIGRLERQRGSATIKSSPGAGTEVALRMELS